MRDFEGNAERREPTNQAELKMGILPVKTNENARL